MKTQQCVCLFLLLCAPAICTAEDDNDIRLIVRADDIGSSHTANLACIRSYRDGIARSVEVMVPAPWFNEAVQMLAENPGYDVGVHLTLTSEWEKVKWGPITPASSLVDRQGHFYPTTSRRGASPGFLQAKPDLDEVDRELRAQIELAVDKIENVTHLSCHMGTATCTPELRALVERLAAEYKLPLDAPDAKRTPRWGGSNTTAKQKEENLVQLLENLEPGLWLTVEHPGLDTPEMRSIGHPGYENVAADRDGVTRAFTSPKVQEVIRRRRIQLISYGDLYAD
jgi:predicted glycoside hydrolase/deacetylase ChbG (UPF0249 family)